MGIWDWLSVALLLTGAFFFFAGTLGLLRFPDVYNRLHALTKADNVGLGLTIVGLAIQSGSWIIAFKLVLIWLLVLVTSATAAHLIANAALHGGVQRWQRS